MKEAKETTIRMTDRLSTIVEKAVQESRHESKKDLIQAATTKRVGFIEKQTAGHEDVKDFIVKLNSDISWVNANIPDSDLTAKFDTSSGLTSVTSIKLSTETEQVLNSIVSSTSLSQSDVIRICIIKYCYDHSEQFNEATQMELSDRWFSIKTKLKHMTETLVANLHFELDPERVSAKMMSGLEQKSIHHIRLHYKDFKQTKGYEVITEMHYGKLITETLDQVLNSDQGH